MQQLRLGDASARMLTATCKGDKETVCTGLAVYSRHVQQGDLFFCISGTVDDGHRYGVQAVQAGAQALVVERELDLPVPQLVVKNARHALAVLADAFYQSPSRQLNLIGITGTNGKTTITYLIEKILTDAKRNTGVIGTIQMRYAKRVLPTSGTTPNALELQHVLRQMVTEGIEVVAMEVSSHALVQGRVQGCHFRTAVFTNLTPEHLDYHKSMKAYRDAKGLLFSRLGNSFADREEDRCYAVLNVDDAAASHFAELTAVETITYGLSAQADVRAEAIHVTAKGTSFKVHTFRGSIDVQLCLIGTFNVYNALAAIAVGLIENIELMHIRDSLQAVTGVPGRMESVEVGQPFTVLVDYAHSPDGLEHVLKTVKQFAAGRVICVFGCGGDRDRMKRPLMGKIVARYADYGFITSDNPRTEEPALIMAHIEAGMQEMGVDESRYPCIVDRRVAITKAIEMASPNDVVLIAGKGHEAYQIIGTETFAFDDRLVAEEAIRGTLK